MRLALWRLCAKNRKLINNKTGNNINSGYWRISSTKKAEALSLSGARVADAGIPRDIKDFLGKYIDSIEQFEILLLLFRQTNKDWAVDAVVSELGAARPVVEKSLDDLVQYGLVTQQHGLYRIMLNNNQQMRLLERLSQFYTDRRVTILNLIFSRHLDRIRAFADSFKMTPKDTDG
jgi:hypothetical protein